MADGRRSTGRNIAALLGALGALGLPASATETGLVAQITSPIDGFKVRPGRPAVVRVHIEARGDSGAGGWTLRLSGPNQEDLPLAMGSGPASDRVVAEVSYEELRAGEQYRLSLTVEGETGDFAAAQVRLVVPAPEYTLIPLEEGNAGRTLWSGLSIDESGHVIAMGGTEHSEIRLLDRRKGTWSVLNVPLAATEGQQLTGDGQRLFFIGTFTLQEQIILGVGFYDFGTRTSTGIAATNSGFFSVDRPGRHVALQAPLAGHSAPFGYYFYDEAGARLIQLTDDPETIVRRSDPLACPRPLGSIPLLSGDGTRVVFITSNSLGIVPQDNSIGCNVFSYDVVAGVMNVAARIRSGIGVDLPRLSRDGRSLSLSIVKTISPYPRQGFPALLDVDTGELTESLIGVTGFTSFDSVITGDGRSVILSTQADLDPRVGNGDHNLEIFVLDRQQNRFTQITDTILGIGQTPGGCPSYRPVANATGEVVLFSFARFSGEECIVDGAQRNESDGLVFRRVRAVKKRHGNEGPDFSPPAKVVATAGDLLTLDLSATDPDGDPVTFFAQEVGGIDVPRGSEIADHHDGTATFTWPTAPEDVGIYQLRVAAFDEGGGEVFHDVEIRIVAGDCTGDCDGNREVVVGELVTGIGIALGNGAIDACESLDADRSAVVTVDELVSAAGNAVLGCDDVDLDSE